MTVAYVRSDPADKRRHRRFETETRRRPDIHRRGLVKPDFSGSRIAKGAGVGALALGGTVFVAYRSSATTNLCWRSTSNLKDWTSELELNIASSVEPALAEYNTQVYFVGASGSGELYACVFNANGTPSTLPSTIPGAVTEYQPNLEWSGGKLVCAYTDKLTAAPQLVGMNSDGTWAPMTAFTAPKPIKGGPSIYSPAPSNLYAYYALADGSIYYGYTTTSMIWSSATAYGPATTSTGPTLNAQGQTLLGVHVGNGGHALWMDQLAI